MNIAESIFEKLLRLKIYGRSQKSIITFVSFLMISTTLFSTDYYTLEAGAWGDVTSVWSTDGVTPCGCTPGYNVSADNIYINHTLQVFQALELVDGTTVTISSTGKIFGGQTLTMGSGAVLTTDGNIQMGVIFINSATMNINPGAVVQFASSANVEGGAVINLDNGAFVAGGIETLAGAVVTLINTSKFFCSNSNFKNAGTLNIGAGSCVESSGNFTNQSTGVINGAGALYSDGNIRNLNFVANTITWCSNANALGMTTPENCALAQTICTALPVILPVELIDFSAEVISREYVKILWSTASEYENDYFVVQSSVDGLQWTDVNKVAGVGTTQEATNYSTDDFSKIQGVRYYRLKQVDLSAIENYSNFISVDVSLDVEVSNIHPNPSSGDVTLLAPEGIEVDQISIVSLSGIDATNKIEIVENGSGRFELLTSELNKGMYIVRVGLETIKFHKL